VGRWRLPRGVRSRMSRRRLRARQPVVARAARLRDAVRRRAARARDARRGSVRDCGRSVSGRPQADRPAAVERSRQFAERDHLAARAISDSGVDDRQHARRRRRVEQRADADGPRGPRHPGRDRHRACDGGRGWRGRYRPARRRERVRVVRQPRVSAAETSDWRCVPAPSPLRPCSLPPPSPRSRQRLRRRRGVRRRPR
jgi:hypothetical protein